MSEENNTQQDPEASDVALEKADAVLKLLSRRNPIAAITFAGCQYAIADIIRGEIGGESRELLKKLGWLTPEEAARLKSELKAANDRLDQIDEMGREEDLLD